MADHGRMRLGRQSPRPTPLLPSILTYTARAPLPEAPATIDWSENIEWPLLANDRVGDCTCAAVLHYAQAAERWHDGVGRPASDAEAVAAYSSVSSYEPQRPETDTGALISVVLEHWHNAGFAAPGGNNRISALVRLDPGDAAQLRQALWLFGPLIIGARLPLAAQTQQRWTAPLDLAGVNAPGSWGGHCMLLTGWHDAVSVNLITWGDVKVADPGWIATYCDEAWAVLHPTWIASGKSPSGWLVETVIADMQELADQ